MPSAHAALIVAVMEHHQHDVRHQHDQEHGDPGTGTDGEAWAELLDLDAEVLHAYLSDLTGWVREEAAGSGVRRILDVGAGTGTGTIALAQRFGAADVIAVDGSEQLLSRIRAKALDLGLADRVQAIRADLDGAWPGVGVGAVDVAWAAMSLHHLADPDRVLGDLFAAIRPGGLLAVAEMGASLRFLPDDLGLGRPGLESRCHAALAGHRARALPNLGADWGPRLERAGFAPIAQRTFAIDLTPPHPPAAGQYAWGSLRRARPALAGELAADDLATLDTLLDRDGPGSLLHRDDLVIRGTRTAWIGRRP
jgi:SAM-dependent methyltransferase